MKRIKIAILTLALLLFGMSAFQPSFSYAYDCQGGETAAHCNACKGLEQVGGQDCGSGASSINKITSAVVTIISIVVGVAGVIMVIVSGLKYITSGGDSAKVSSAKTTLIYALIGLAIAAAAQFLVHFVLGNTHAAISYNNPILNISRKV